MTRLRFPLNIAAPRRVTAAVYTRIRLRHTCRLQHTVPRAVFTFAYHLPLPPAFAVACDVVHLCPPTACSRPTTALPRRVALRARGLDAAFTFPALQYGNPIYNGRWGRMTTTGVAHRSFGTNVLRAPCRAYAPCRTCHINALHYDRCYCRLRLNYGTHTRCDVAITLPLPDGSTFMSPAPHGRTWLIYLTSSVELPDKHWHRRSFEMTRAAA